MSVGINPKKQNRIPMNLVQTFALKHIKIHNYSLKHNSNHLLHSLLHLYETPLTDVTWRYTNIATKTILCASEAAVILIDKTMMLHVSQIQ